MNDEAQIAADLAAIGFQLVRLDDGTYTAVSPLHGLDTRIGIPLLSVVEAAKNMLFAVEIGLIGGRRSHQAALPLTSVAGGMRDSGMHVSRRRARRAYRCAECQRNLWSPAKRLRKPRKATPLYWADDPRGGRVVLCADCYVRRMARAAPHVTQRRFDFFDETNEE